MDWTWIQWFSSFTAHQKPPGPFLSALTLFCNCDIKYSFQAPQTILIQVVPWSTLETPKIGCQPHHNLPKEESVSLNVSHLNSMMWSWALKHIYLCKTHRPVHKTHDFKLCLKSLERAVRRAQIRCLDNTERKGPFPPLPRRSWPASSSEASSQIQACCSNLAAKRAFKLGSTPGGDLIQVL